ncbi:hypothetical protein KM043_012933 [Ampulex compressa]|nr:hypothetical protein KM043_012933 [Ampulex compressa]
MSASVGQRILRHFCANNLRKCVTQNAIVRLSSNHAEKKSNTNQSTNNVIVAPEPGKVHAAVLQKFCSPLVIENVEPPKTLQTDEVVIDVHYCALNSSDVLLSKNAYTFEPNLPIILGYEIVGKLVQVGAEAEKSGFKVGDKVVALNKDCCGGLAEQCIAEIGDLWKIPSTIKSLDAVSLLDNYITALVALERKVSVQEDDMILINIGISGIGLAAVDLATNVFRAKVVGICATENGAQLARDKGAFASFKFKERKLLKQIEEIAADRDIKAIFDDADGEYFKKILHCFTDVYKDETLKELLRDDNFAVVVHHLSREGRVIVAGTATTMTEAHSEVQKNSFSVTGLDLREYRKKKPEVYRQAGDDVLQFFEEGLIKPTTSLIVGLHKINDAIQFASEGKSAGKVIIDVKNKEADMQKENK